MGPAPFRWLLVAQRFALAALILVIGFSAVVTFWPERTPQPLVAKTGWHVSGPFVDVRDRLNDYPGSPAAELALRKSVRMAPDAVFFRSSIPRASARSTQYEGTVRTDPFPYVSHILVPVQHRTGNLRAPLEEVAARVRLECIGTGRSIPIARGVTGPGFSEAVLAIPKGFCAGPLRLTARMETPEEIGLGTPFRISRLAYWKTKLLGLLFGYACACAFAAVSVLGAVILLARAGCRCDPRLLLALLPGAMGYLEFFAYQISPGVGLTLAMSGFLVGAAGLAIALHQTRFLPNEIVSRVGTPLIIWFLAGLAYTAFLYAADNGAGVWLSNSRFYPAIWADDNQLPRVVAEALGRGELREAMQGAFGHFAPEVWQVSDRPPLFSGQLLWVRPVMLLLGLAEDGPHLFGHFYNVVTILFDAFWAPLLWLCLSAFTGLRKADRVLILVLLCLTPLALFNTPYGWPKLVSGALALSALTLGLRHWLERGPTREQESSSPYLAMALLSGASLLFHASDFPLLGVLWTGVLVRELAARRPFRALVPIGLIALILAPWTLWQRLADPPGNRLMKYGLAHTVGFHENGVGLVETVRQFYASLTLQAWLQAKMTAARILLGLAGLDEITDFGWSGTPGGTIREYGLIGLMRVRDFLLPGSGALLFMICLAGCALLGWRLGKARRNAKTWRAGWLLVGVSALTCALVVLVFQPDPVVQQLPYSAQLAFLVGSALVAHAVGGWALRALVVAQAVYSGLVWILSPLLGMVQVDPLALGILVAIAFVIAPTLGSLGHDGRTPLAAGPRLHA